MSKKWMIVLFVFLIFISVPTYFIITALQDRQGNNIPDSIEKIVPKFVKNFLVNNLFVTKSLKNTISVLRKNAGKSKTKLEKEEKIVDELLDEMYALGLDSLKFFRVLNKNEISSNKSNLFTLTTFQTNYLSISTWPHIKASVYLERYKDKTLLVSKNGIISYFSDQDLQKKEFYSKIIPNNIRKLINYDDFFKQGGRGIKDVFIDENKIYISYSNQLEENCYNTSILFAYMNFDFLNFENFFTPPTCLKARKGYNRWTYNVAGGSYN